MNKFTIILITLTILVLAQIACGVSNAAIQALPTAEKTVESAKIQPQIQSQTVKPTSDPYPREMVVIGEIGSACWHIRSAPEIGDNRVGYVCPGDTVMIYGVVENGFVQITPPGDGARFICGQAIGGESECE